MNLEKFKTLNQQTFVQYLYSTTNKPISRRQLANALKSIARQLEKDFIGDPNYGPRPTISNSFMDFELYGNADKDSLSHMITLVVRESLPKD